MPSETTIPLAKLPVDCRDLSTAQMLSLNRTCQCVPLHDSLADEFRAEYLNPKSAAETRLQSISAPARSPTVKKTGHPLLVQETRSQSATPPSHTSMFSSTAVFVTHSDLRAMQQQIDAIETTASLPLYRERIRQRSQIELHHPQANTKGLFMGYDFHLTAEGPRLIEVNTNAGGAFMMQAMLSVVRQNVTPCQTDTLDDPVIVERKIIESFLHEWQLAGKTGKPETIAIVDNQPQQQFLYPELLLAKAMLERHDINAVICTPESLTIRNGNLYSNTSKVDFVYNRSTDFYLSEVPQRTLEKALRNNQAVVSPAPAHHALFADKRNPAIWQSQLNTLGAVPATTESLAQLPTTEHVTPTAAASLWNRRKTLFFKPNAGYGSKATYRGDKLTRKVWQHIVKGGYIAQTLEPPPLRVVGEGDNSSLMKFDVRVFTYNGQRLLSAARVYQGQTTNFRTPGGGFAPVIYLD